MGLSTAMWQAGRYTSFHNWFGDYPEGTPNYNNLHDNMIPKYKSTKESFETNAFMNLQSDILEHLITTSKYPDLKPNQSESETKGTEIIENS